MKTLYDSLLKYKDTNLKALYFENNEFTYKTLINNTQKMMPFFKEKGIKKGDVVTLVLPNIPSTICCFYALNAMGVILNIIHPLTTFNNIISSMKDVGSNYAIVLATLYKDNEQSFIKSEYTFFFANPMEDSNFLLKNIFYLKYKKVKENSHLFLLDKYKRCVPNDYSINYDENNTSIYLHSGGTTGTPKIICLSNSAINNLANKVKNDILKVDPTGKAMLAVLPSFHGFGLAMGIHAPLSNGAISALMIKFNTKKVVRWINQNKVNYIIGVPLLYQKLLNDKDFINAKLENLEFCFIGGDNVSTSLIEKFNNLMKEKNSSNLLLEGYGLTETVTVCSVNTKDNFKMGSVGKPLGNIEFKILDENNNQLNENEIGEVYISGDTLMNGYLNDEITTNKTLIDINNKKYIKTGDLGYLDNDGFLFLKGRIKRVFKISGINVYPSEVEKIVTDLKDVYDASLEYFDNNGPHLNLYIIKNKNSTRTDSELIELIQNRLKNEVLKYSLPKNIVFIDKFPKTNVGKIDHKAFSDINK